MKVLLQHVRTGSYLANDSDWTSLPAEARDFSTALCALDAYKTIECEMRVVLVFPVGNYSVSVALSEDNDSSLWSKMKVGKGPV